MNFAEPRSVCMRFSPVLAVVLLVAGASGASPPSLASPVECAQFCNIVMGHCGVYSYPNTSSCLAACAAMPSVAAPAGTDTTQGDSVQCREYHGGAPAKENAALHCTHASSAGGGVCETTSTPLCATYCANYTASCSAIPDVAFASHRACAVACASYPEVGTPVAQTFSGDSVQCRAYHAGAPAQGDPAVHCAHASPSGGGVCVEATPPTPPSALVGNTSSSAVLDSGGLLGVEWTIAEDRSAITYTVRLRKRAWLAFGLCGPSGMMIGSEPVVARPVQLSPLAEYTIRSRALSSIELRQGPSRLANASLTQTTASTTAVFTKRLGVVEGGGRAEALLGSNAFCWAFGNDNILSYHGGSQRGATIIDFNSSTPVQGRMDQAAAPEPLIEAHATLMVAAYALLLPSGVSAAYFCRTMGQEGWWFKLHRGIQMLGLVTALLGFGCIIAAFDSKGQAHFEIMHHKLGLAVMSFAIFQPIGAVLRPHKGKPRVGWRIMHRGMGYLTLCGGIANCLTGLDLDTTNGFPAFRGKTSAFFYISICSVVGMAAGLRLIASQVDQSDVFAATTPMLQSAVGDAGTAWLRKHVPRFLDMVSDAVRSKTMAVATIVFIFLQALSLVEGAATSSSTSDAYGYGEHTAVLAIVALPVLVGNSLTSSHLYTLTAFVIVPASVASSLIVSGYMGFEFDSGAIALIVVVAVFLIGASGRLLVKFSSSAGIHAIMAAATRQRAYVKRLLSGRKGALAGTMEGRRRGCSRVASNGGRAQKVAPKNGVPMQSPAGKSADVLRTIGKLFYDNFFIDARECRPFPLRFLLAQALSLLVVVKLGSFMLGPGQDAFISLIDSYITGTRDTFLLAAAMNRELAAQTEPMEKLCAGRVPGVTLPEVFEGQQALCDWRADGVSGSVVQGGKLTTNPALDFESAANKLTELSTTLKDNYSAATGLSIFAGVANFALSFGYWQTTIVAIRTGRLKFNPERVSSSASDYIGVQFSTAIVQLLSAFSLFQLLLLLFTYSPASNFVFTLLQLFLPVIIVAVFLKVVKMLWVDTVLTEDGRVIIRDWYVLWDFAMLFYGAVEGLLKAVSRFFVSLIANTIFLGRTDVPILPGNFFAFDLGFMSYINVALQSELHNNPIQSVACQTLMEGLKAAKAAGEAVGATAAPARSRRQSNPRARLRWVLAYTLLKNPALIPFRKQALPKSKKRASDGFHAVAIGNPVGDRNPTTQQMEKL